MSGFACTGLISGCSKDQYRTAHMMLQAGDFLSARKIYNRIVDRNPADFEGQYGLGMTWCAEAIYKTELGLAEPDDWYPAIYHVSLGANIRNGEEVRKTLAVLHFNLGACYRKAGNTTDAIERIEQALEYDSTLTKALNLLGAMYHEEGNLEKAEDCYLHVVELHPDYALAFFNLGAVAWAKDDFPSAQRDFSQALSLDPGNEYYKMWLSRAAERTRSRK